MSCFTVDELMSKNRQLANENDELRENLSCLKKEKDQWIIHRDQLIDTISKLSEELSTTKSSLEERQKENQDMCSKYWSAYDRNVELTKKVEMLNTTVERQKSVIIDLRSKSRQGKELTVDDMLKVLSRSGANSVVIGLK